MGTELSGLGCDFILQGKALPGSSSPCACWEWEMENGMGWVWSQIHCFGWGHPSESRRNVPIQEKCPHPGLHCHESHACLALQSGSQNSPSKGFQGVPESPELGGSHRDQQLQLLALQRFPKIAPVPEGIALLSLGAVTQDSKNETKQALGCSMPQGNPGYSSLGGCPSSLRSARKCCCWGHHSSAWQRQIWG